MNNRKKWILVIALVGIIICLLPIFIDWLIIGNKFPSKITNSDWGSFLGSYIGSILGTLGSLIGIIWTIRYTSSENRKDRELQVHPYFDIRYIRTKEFLGTNRMRGYLACSCDSVEDKGPHLYAKLLFKNVGQASAINCHLGEIEIIDNRKHFGMLFANCENAAVTSLQPGEEGCLSVNINLNYDEIPESAITYEGEHRYFDLETMQKYSHHTVKVRFYYSDI